MRALIVHDDPHRASELAQGLAQKGYRVDVVDSGLAAIRQIWEERYDRVLVDAGLRGMRATSLMRHIGELSPRAVIELLIREHRAA
jgi:DNA-binding response OmpR family regulator